MKELATGLSGFTVFLSLAAIFVLVFLIIARVLRQTSFFKGKTSVIIAVCVSLLSVMGLYEIFGARDTSDRITHHRDVFSFNLNFILVPCATLSLAMLSLMLIRFIDRVFRNKRPKRFTEETKRRMEYSRRSR